MAAVKPVCTSCGKKGTAMNSDSGTTKRPPHPTYVLGKCPNTKDGKHILVWQPQ